MIKVYKGIKILEKPLGKLKKNNKKLSPDEIINSKNYYVVKSFAPLKLAKKNDYILYTLYNKYNRYLGSAHVYFSEIDDINNIGNAHIQIIPNYQRKGLATFLYNFIEKDLKIKLRPSSDPSKDAKAFWKHRLKQNPTDKNFLKSVTIQKVKNKKLISYNAYYNNKYIGGADFDLVTKTIFDIWISTEYRRKGLATFLYDKIEKDQKIKLVPSSTLFPDGRQFWKNRLGLQNDKSI